MQEKIQKERLLTETGEEATKKKEAFAIDKWFLEA